MFVDLAGSPQECRAFLDHSFYHLAVFDISMTAGFDRRGLDLLVDLHNTSRIDAMAVIVVTGFATVDAATAAMEGHPNVRFYRKEEFDNRRFLSDALQLLGKTVPINLNLDVVWQRGTNGEVGGPDLLLNLRIQKRRVRKNEPLFERVAGEFDDLIARTFHDATRVVLTPMNPGKSGAGVVKARPFFEHGGGTTVVLKFGDVDDIELENKNFDKYVHRYLGSARFTSIHNRTHTWLLGGTSYSFLGAADFVDFPTFYAKASEREVITALDALFLDTCAPWYENAGPVQLRDIGAEYRTRLGCDADNLKVAFQKLKNVQGGTSIVFTSLLGTRKFPNPLRVVSDEQIVYSTHEAVTHGDLNGSNIMVDRTGTCWLIDFFHTGPGHVLRDLALLDGAIRWTILSPSEATLNERLAMEEALLDATDMDGAGNLIGHLETDNEALGKAFRTSLHIRSIAARQNRKRTMNELQDYAAASMFYGLNLIRFLRLPDVQREHALLSAALTVERLRL
jgi:hypothetical protein